MLPDNLVKKKKGLGIYSEVVLSTILTQTEPGTVKPLLNVVVDELCLAKHSVKQN